ncbi:MAG: putative sugar nucleotidyl transferase [Ginsengibacter sp.]
MDILLDDLPYKNSLYPFTALRSLVHIRIGILTILEKWQLAFPGKILFSSNWKSGDPVSALLKIPANCIPSHKLIQEIQSGNYPEISPINSKELLYPWQVFQWNDWAIREDIIALTAEKKFAPIPASNKAICPENIFIEEGAKVEYSILNGEHGPIYIGKNAQVMEGCLIRGPFAACDGSVLKMGTRVYGATTLGPHCIGGGEIKNSVLMGYSNKSHDGYLGDSVLGYWCNLGAGTSNSNLKNTAGIVNVWDHAKENFVPAGTKCGLLMGDYSRCAINTSFNTGTVAGICCNIFGNSFPAKYIHDFTWGNETYKLDKALSDIDKWKQLKAEKLTVEEADLLKNYYELKRLS